MWTCWWYDDPTAIDGVDLYAEITGTLDVEQFSSYSTELEEYYSNESASRIASTSGSADVDVDGATLSIDSGTQSSAGVTAPAAGIVVIPLPYTTITISNGAAPNPVSTSPNADRNTASSTFSNDQSKGTEKGTIAGAAIGSFLGAAAIFGAAIFLLRRRKTKGNTKTDSTDGPFLPATSGGDIPPSEPSPPYQDREPVENKAPAKHLYNEPKLGPDVRPQTQTGTSSGSWLELQDRHASELPVGKEERPASELAS